MNGKCVRLTKGDFSTQKIYHEDPVEQAKIFEDAGVQYLHVVDLDGAKAGKIINYSVLKKIAAVTKLITDFGGGIRTNEDIEIAFENGASQITGGSIALQKPGLFAEWLDRYGSEKIILGADCRNRKIATAGWQKESSADVVDFIEGYEKAGVKYVVCTDIDTDGMLSGPAISLYREIMDRVPVKLIASGGVSSLDDLFRLKKAGCDGAIIGKAIYEGRILLNELKSLC
jgi:phosphoribosylformimino-5-aminoimidazole carboxamide ribotide isomerase